MERCRVSRSSNLGGPPVQSCALIQSVPPCPISRVANQSVITPPLFVDGHGSSLQNVKATVLICLQATRADGRCLSVLVGQNRGVKALIALAKKREKTTTKRWENLSNAVNPDLAWLSVMSLYSHSIETDLRVRPSETPLLVPPKWKRRPFCLKKGRETGDGVPSLPTWPIICADFSQRANPTLARDKSGCQASPDHLYSEVVPFNR